MEDFWRLCGFIVYCAACAALLVIIAMALPGVEAEHTARYNMQQQQETLREQARQQGETARWQATTAAAPWVIAAGGLTAVLIVAAVQVGRSHRHAQSEQTKRRALLVWYVANCLPPGTNVQIGTWRGELAVINHDDGEIIPYSVASLEVGGRRLLTD